MMLTEEMRCVALANNPFQAEAFAAESPLTPRELAVFMRSWTKLVSPKLLRTAFQFLALPTRESDTPHARMVEAALGGDLPDFSALPPHLKGVYSMLCSMGHTRLQLAMSLIECLAEMEKRTARPGAIDISGDLEAVYG